MDDDKGRDDVGARRLEYVDRDSRNIIVIPIGEVLQGKLKQKRRVRAGLVKLGTALLAYLGLYAFLTAERPKPGVQEGSYKAGSVECRLYNSSEPQLPQLICEDKTGEFPEISGNYSGDGRVGRFVYAGRLPENEDDAVAYMRGPVRERAQKRFDFYKSHVVTPEHHVNRHAWSIRPLPMVVR